MPRNVLVTGAAQGIGRAIAGRFAAKGWTVGCYDIDAEGAERAATEIGGVGGGLDVRDEQAWAKVLAEFTATTGSLDVLVNNAGIVAAGAFAELPLSQHLAVVDVNLRGVLVGAHSAFPYFRPGSAMVTLCSASALYGQPTLAVYGATKSAVRSLTEALDLEWRDQGIRARDVLPLFVSTALGDAAKGDRFGLLGVHTTVDDVAAAVFSAAVHPGAAPHRLVGLQTKASALAVRLGPSALTHRVVGRLAR